MSSILDTIMNDEEKTILDEEGKYTATYSPAEAVEKLNGLGPLDPTIVNEFMKHTYGGMPITKPVSTGLTQFEQLEIHERLIAKHDTKIESLTKEHMKLKIEKDRLEGILFDLLSVLKSHGIRL